MEGWQISSLALFVLLVAQSVAFWTVRGEIAKPVEHHDERLRPWQVADGKDRITGVFTGCTIVGPAVLVVSGDFALVQNVVKGGADAFLWPVERERVAGAFEARDCEFRGCTFERVGFAGPPELVEKIRATIEEES